MKHRSSFHISMFSAVLQVCVTCTLCRHSIRTRESFHTRSIHNCWVFSCGAQYHTLKFVSVLMCQRQEQSCSSSSWMCETRHVFTPSKLRPTMLYTESWHTGAARFTAQRYFHEQQQIYLHEVLNISGMPTTTTHDTFQSTITLSSFKVWRCLRYQKTHSIHV